MRTGLIFALIVLLTAAAHADRYPAASGVIDVTASPYNAAGDGLADDTAAINAAIRDAAASARIVYLPAGTYRVTDTLAPEPDVFYFNIEGESRESVVIRLDAAAAGFSDPLSPKPVIHTAPAAAGWTNNSFMCNVANLTLEVGAGNPGAAGILFIGNNQASIREVTIRSLDPELAGHAAIDMASMSLPGPGLIRNVRTEGFDYGLRIAHEQYGITLEHVEVIHPRVAGVEVIDNLFMARNLRVVTQSASVPALLNANANAMSILLDSELETSGSGPGAAVINQGFLYLRGISESGYGSVLDDRGSQVEAISEEYTSHPVIELFPSGGASLDLPVEEIPVIPMDDPSTWISVADYGAAPGTDSTTAIQAAIDAASEVNGTVYFPNLEGGAYETNRTYLISETIHLRGNLRRFVGMNARLKATAALRGQRKPMFLLEDGSSDWLVIEKFFIPWGTAGEHTLFENRRSQGTVFQHIFATQDQFYHGLGASGTTHFVDVTAGHDGNDLGPAPLFHFGPDETIYARQLNPEIFDGHITNEGGRVWIYGLKTEREGPHITNRLGGEMEIIGAMIHPRNIGVPEEMRVITNDQADISFVGREANSNSTSYAFIAEFRRGSETRILQTLDDGVPIAIDGSDYSFAIPLLVERGADASPVRGALASQLLAQDRIELVWDPVAGAREYRISRGVYQDGRDRSELGIVSSTAYVDTGLPVGSRFWYWIEPVMESGFAGLSSAIPGTTAPGLAAPPEWVRATGGSGDPVALDWQWVQGASLYYVWRHDSDDPAAATRIGTVTDPVITSYVDDDAPTDGPLYYWIQPFTIGYGLGDYSAVVTPESGSWAGFPYADVPGRVDTGAFLGWLHVEEPYVFSYSLSSWLYLPESSVTDTGAWVFIPR